MKVASVLPYYGGKRTLAPQIVGLMRPDRRMLVDACCGSLAVLMAAEPCAMEVANDLYGGVVLLARVLASDRYDDLANRVARTMAHEHLFDEACANEPDLVPPPERVDDVADEHVEAAYWLLVQSWIGRNGVAGSNRGNRTAARRYTPNGGSGGVRWTAVAESIAPWHERLARVWFQQVDACELLGKLEDIDGLVVYLDPPYLGRPGERYVYPFDDEQHRLMAAAAGRFERAQVLVSYQEHPKLAELYPESDGWQKVTLRGAPTQANSTKRGPGRSDGVERPAEVVMVNRMNQQRDALWEVA